MAKSIRVISRYIKAPNGDLIPDVFTKSIVQGVSYTMITPQIDADLDEGDLCIVQIDGLTLGQLNAAKSRADVIYLTDGDNGNTGLASYDFLDDKPSKAELRQLATKLGDLFNVPPAKIAKWIDENGTPTRAELCDLINKMIFDGKPKRQKGSRDA